MVSGSDISFIKKNNNPAMDNNNGNQENTTPGTNKVYPYQSGAYELISDKDRPTPREDLELIQYGEVNSGDQKIKASLVGNKGRLNEWLISFKSKSSGDQRGTARQENIGVIEGIYSGMILLRRLTRLLLQIIFISLVIGLFAWGYFVTVKNTSWTAGKDVTNIAVFVGNCFVNVSQSDNQLQFTYKAKGSLGSQVNGSDEYRIKGEILDTGTANLTFYNSFTDITTCIVDLYVPKTIDHLNLTCRAKSECIVVFGQKLLEINQIFNATSESKASLQMNFRNIKAQEFIYYSHSQGFLFLNHFLIQKANIEMLSGDIVLQSTKPFNLNFTTSAQGLCTSAYDLVSSSLSNCQFGQNDTIIPDKDCSGQIQLCKGTGSDWTVIEDDGQDDGFWNTSTNGTNGGASDCDTSGQQINVIGNSSTIYANVIYNIGRPMIKGVDNPKILATYPFSQGSYKFAAEGKHAIETFMNKSGSADVAVRLDVGGHYLLQSSWSTYWTYFSNPSYAAFSPWWLSAFSATFLNPQFAHFQLSVDPGICPWNPVLNARQSLLIQDLIKSTFNTTYGTPIFIQRDDFVIQNETLNSSYKYTGFKPLFTKERGKYENWSTIQNLANNLVFQPLSYDPFFIAAIALSLLSSLIFGLVCILVLTVALQSLEQFVIEQSSQFQHYSASSLQSAKDALSAIAKKMIAKLDTLSNKRDPPILLGVLSYVFYAFGQQNVKSGPKMFCKTIFKKSNINQTKKYYDGSLEPQYLSIDEEDIKEQYEQFCFLNKLTIEPLSQQEQLLETYGFEINEKDNVLIVAKIKMNPNAKTFQELGDQEKTSGNSLELFMATQCLLTGIIADTIASDKLEQAYHKFCGKTLKIEPFNVKDISNDYGLLISDLKAYELRKIRTGTQQRQSWYIRFLGRCTHYIPFIEDYYLEQPVFILRGNTEISKFMQNPIKTMSAKQLNKNRLFYNYPFMFIQSLIFNYKTRIFNREYSYREKDDGNVLMDYFDALYMQGWIWTDIIVVLGNFLVTAVTIIPLLYFIIIINTSYSPFSIYDPKNLLYMSDALNRPWTITDFFGILDYWVLVLGILLAYYSIITFLFQSVKYLLSYFPDEVGYMWEFKLYQNGFMKYFNWFQWIQFLILAFSVFFYFGLIIVWLLLGAIINPNYFLVYSSSAFSLVAFIAAQISEVRSTYEQACVEIKKIVSDIYLKTFGQLAGALIKEIQKLSDMSTTIINSTNMDSAKEMASQLGFGEELNELCILTQGMIDGAGSTDLNADQINFKAIKDKFVDKACEKFVRIAKDQFDVPEIIAEQLVKANFVKFEEIIDPLANQIQIQSQNKIPATIVKWFYQTAVKLQRVFSKKTPEQQRKELQLQLPIISVFLLDAVIDGVMLKTQIDDKGASQQALKSVVQAMFNIMMDKSSKNVLFQIKRLFENIKDYVSISPVPLQALEMIFNFAQALNNNEHVEEAKQDLIRNLLSLYNIDQDIAAVFQMLFTKQQSLFMDKGQQVTPTEQANLIIRVSEKYLLKDNIDDKIKAKFDVFILFAMKFLKNDKPPLKELVKLLAQLSPGNAIENEEQYEQLLEEYSGLMNIALSTLQLCTKNWKQELSISLQGKQLELLNDILFISSKFLWSSNFLDNESSNQTSNASSDKDNWDKDIFSRPAARNASRKDKLNNRDFIELLSLAFQISESSSIGLVLVLRNEISQSQFHQAIYQDLVKIAVKNVNSQANDVAFIFELMSITNFEEVFVYLVQQKRKTMIDKLLDIIFQSRTMFRIFNGYQVVEKIIDLSLEDLADNDKQQHCLIMAWAQLFGKEYLDLSKEAKEQLKKDMQQNKNKQQMKQADALEEQLVNYYKSEKVTFFSFLKRQQKGETTNKKEKSDFLDCVNISVEIKLDYIYMLLELQQGVMLNNSLNQPLLQGLKVEPLKNLLALLTFKDAVAVQKSIQYFTTFNPKLYEGVDFNKVQVEMQKYIDVEQTISNFQLPNTIPHQFAKLANLFINQMFSTAQSMSFSLYNDLFNYLKYELNTFEIKKSKKVSFYFDPVTSSDKDNQQNSLEELKNLQKIVPFSEKFTKMMFSKNTAVRNVAIQDIIKLLYPQPPEQQKQQRERYPKQVQQLSDFIASLMDKNYGQVLGLVIKFCEKLPEEKFKKFYQKVLHIIRGFVTTEPATQEDDSIKELIWATQQLKFFLSSDLQAFMELLITYFNKMLSSEKPNMNAIQALFSLMTNQPDYDLLVNIFEFDEDALRFAYFLVKAIFSEDKSKLIQDNHVRELIEKKFSIKDVMPLVQLSEILESNSMEPKDLIIKLKLDQDPIMSKLFKAIFAFKRQLGKGTSWKQLQTNFDVLVTQRAEILNQDKDQKKQPQQKNQAFEILEVLHWFAHPRPVNFLLLLDKIQMLDSQEPAALFTAAIGAIGKFDKFDQYLEKQPEQIRNRADNVQKLQLKSVDKALLYIVENSDQDVQEAFSLLQLATGINPVLVHAIFYNDQATNNSLNLLLQQETVQNQKIIKDFLKELDNYTNIDALLRLKIIEFETLSNAKSPLLNTQVRDQYQKNLNLNEQTYGIIERFVVSVSKGKLQSNFPMSSLVLIFSLKHMRQTRKSNDKPQAQYIKGQHLINIAFSVFERYLFFFEHHNLVSLNKPLLVKLLTMGIFETTKLRTADKQIDYDKLEGLLYPGLSDPLLEIQGTKQNYATVQQATNSDSCKYFNDNYEQFCKVFVRVAPENVDVRPEYLVYNEFWNSLLKSGVNQPVQQLSMVYVNKNSQKKPKEYFEDLQNKYPKEMTKLQIQCQVLSQLSQVNIQQFGFIRSKYWEKSIELLKKYIFKPSEIEEIENDQQSEQMSQIIVGLFSYYANQYTVNQREPKQQQKPQQTDIKLLEGMFGDGQKYRATQKYRAPKMKVPTNLNLMIDSLLGLQLNETERKELRPLVDLFYNPKSMDTEFIKKTWGNDAIIMDALMLMLVRVQLEQSKQTGKFAQLASKVPACYLYYSLGDQYENLSEAELEQYRNNSNSMNLGVDELIQDCNEIQPSIKGPLKLMIRCFLGDVEAWYALIAFSRRQDSLETEYLSERMIRTFIVELLLQFKNLGLRSSKFDKQSVTSQSFSQLIESQMNVNLIKTIETSLMNTFSKDKEEYPVESTGTILKFLSFIFEGKIEVLENENGGFMEILQKVLGIDPLLQSNLIYVIQFLLQLLFKGDKDNSNFVKYEQKLDILRNEYEAPWKFVKCLIEIDHSKNINVLVKKSYQLLQDNNLGGFTKYANILVSLSAPTFINYYQQNDFDKKKIANVLMYPLVWIASLIDSEKSPEPLKPFIQFSKQYVNVQTKDFEETLDWFYTHEKKDNSNSSAVSQENVDYFKKALAEWCQQNADSDFGTFVNFVETNVLGLKNFPQPLQIVLNTLLALLFNQKLSSDPKQELLRQFIQEITKFEGLQKEKQIVEAIIIEFSSLQNSQDTKDKKLQKAIEALLSKSEIGDIIKTIFLFYESGKVEDLKELPLLIQKCCFTGELYTNKFSNIPLAQFFQVASNAQLMITSLEDKQNMDEAELLKLVKPVLVPIFGSKQEEQKDLNILIKCIEAMIAIKHKKLNEVTSEFFQVMKISQSNSQLLIQLMQDFQTALTSPQQLIKEKMASLINPNTTRTMQYMNSVMTKLNDNRELQFEDMYRVIDKNGQRSVKATEVLEFLRRINIEVTEHKFKEVLVNVKEDQVNILTCMVDFYEFKEIMQQISVQTMLLSLQYLGISKSLLIRALVVLIVYLVIVLAFILIGVQAFAIPGTFAAIVNAALPLIGGLGLNRQAAEERLKALNGVKILEIVKKAVKVIQSRRI